MEQTIEALSDMMRAKEEEGFYKSKGQDIPSAKSLEEAREHLRQVEANLYRGEE